MTRRTALLLIAALAVSAGASTFSPKSPATVAR
jgi:hypothetical protein